MIQLSVWIVNVYALTKKKNMDGYFLGYINFFLLLCFLLQLFVLVNVIFTIQQNSANLPIFAELPHGRWIRVHECNHRATAVHEWLRDSTSTCMYTRCGWFWARTLSVYWWNDLTRNECSNIVAFWDIFLIFVSIYFCGNCIEQAKIMHFSNKIFQCNYEWNIWISIHLTHKIHKYT